MKIIRPVLFTLVLFLGSFSLYGKEPISPSLLDKLNEERTKNNLEKIPSEEEAEDMVQNELDRRVKMNLDRLEQKKAPLPSMPIAERWGAQNKERESLRKNAIKNRKEYWKEKKKALK